MAVRAGDIMTRAVVTAGPDDDVSTVAGLLTKHGISGMPVCDKDGALLGIISEGDLMRPFGEANSLRRDWWLALLAEGERLAPDFLDYIRLDRRRARDLMTAKVVVATEDTPAQKLADLLRQHGVKRLPIMKDGKVIGIVSRADLIHAVAQRGDLT
jgi:CBS domain-containing protein